MKVYYRYFYVSITIVNEVFAIITEVTCIMFIKRFC